MNTEDIKNINLNDCSIRTDNNRWLPLENNNFVKDNISVYFRNLKRHLIDEINKAEVVVGCVAWLTSEDILKALAQKKRVSIIVQKEDFLRPDNGNMNNNEWKKRLHELYDGVHNEIPRFLCPEPLSSMSFLSDGNISAIRCCGVNNLSKQKPNMHNKFLVFAKWQEPDPKSIPLAFECAINELNHESPIKPYAVWTGSYNLSKNSEKSFENAVLIYDKNIAKKYLSEWANISALSEELNWVKDWVEPEWRIGS